MTIDADKNIRKLARRIIEDAGLPYTEAQLKEIPAILAAKRNSTGSTFLYMQEKG